MNALRFLVGLLFACATVASAWAQAYPSKPIRLISPYPPGGGTDATARIIAQALGEQMGQQIIVDSRAGASGRIGTELASKSPADGYTMVLGNVAPLAILPGSGIKLPYDAIGSFSPISLIALSDYVLTVHPSLPARSVKELLAIAKARPGELTYASSGNLGGPHLGGELINLMAKVKLLHVPYKGNGPAAIAVLTGESTLLFGSGPTVVPHVRAGRLRALATTGKKRSIRDLPAMNELLPGYEVTQWYGVVTCAKVSPGIIRKLNAGIAEALKSPDVVQRLAADGSTATSSSPEAFGAQIKSEIAKWGKLAKDAGLVLN